MSSKLILVFILFLAIFTRFYGIDWGNSYFFHPDENNMAAAITKLSTSDLNPHFYAYGQFPLYLTFFANGLHNLDFSTAIYSLRLLSATVSVLSVFLIYLISKLLLNSQSALISALIAIFTPGLIQLAHFGTTESLLILFFLLQIYLALKFNRQNKAKYIYIAGAFLGLSLGTKISSIFFAIPFIICLLKYKKYKLLLTYLFLGYIFLLLSSPYNLVNFTEFMGSMNYETSVARGTLPVFYTQQFKGSLPYIFPLLKIFPFALGIFGFITLLFSFRPALKDNKYVYYIFLPSIIYFLYFGQLYTKWYRFSSPLFILPSLTIPYFLKISKKYIYLILVFTLFPGLVFFTRYFQTDPRIDFSNWAISNLKPNSLVFSEAGNVINLPIFPSSLKVENYDFYQPESLGKYQDLANALNTADYILVPSRRVYSNYNNSNFPSIQNYYQNLFSEKKFKLIKTFAPFPQWLMFNQAEETFTVFDSPTIFIYKRL